MNILLGTKIGMLNVLSVDYKSKEYTCKCDCGNICKKSIGNMKKSYSCGCTRKQKEPVINKVNHDDRIGKKQGNLTIINSEHSGKHILTVLCDCGNIFTIQYGSMFGSRLSCGCGIRNKALGMSSTNFYRQWFEMILRCRCERNVSYKSYGGRGIKVIGRDTFKQFKEDMYDSFLEHIKVFGKKDTSLDRIDNDGNYCKENCRWATSLEQANNRSNSLKTSGVPLSVKAKELGISYNKAWVMFKKGKL